MYKTRNTGTRNGMQGTRGMGGMLYFGKCRQIFRAMYSNIPGNVGKHSGECSQTFWGMSSNIPVECRQTFRGILPNIPRNVAKHSAECSQTFRGMSPNIPGNVAEHSGECPICFDRRELVEASSITVVFSAALLIVFCVKNLAKLLAARLKSGSMS